MTANVAINETETATTGTSVARRFRKKAKTTTITSSTARINVRSTSRNDVRMVVERSTATPMSMAGEIEALSWGSSAFTRSTVLMMFAPGCL